MTFFTGLLLRNCRGHELAKRRNGYARSGMRRKAFPCTLPRVYAGCVAGEVWDSTQKFFGDMWDEIRF